MAMHDFDEQLRAGTSFLAGSAFYESFCCVTNEYDGPLVATRTAIPQATEANVKLTCSYLADTQRNAHA